MSEAHFSVEGGREVVHVSADKECVWGATTDADWLSIYLARRMGGTWTKGIVYFDVAPNNDTSLQREGTVTVGDQTIRVVQEGAPEVPLVAGEVREDSVHSDTRQAAWKYYWIDVPPNSRGELDVRLLNATAQANLYVRYGEKPTLHDYDCRPFFGGTSTEHCFLMDPAPGRWWIGVNNWDQRRIDYKVTATYSVRETRFTEWQAAYFSTAERDDPDVSGTQADPGDYGIKNLLRYAFVLDPRQPAREGLPVVRFDRSGPDPVALLEYRRPTAAVDLTYQAEASSDLLDWAPASGESEIVPVSPGVERVRIRLPVPDSGARRKFLRLRVRYDADG